MFRHGPRLKGKKKELEEDENAPTHSAKRPKMSTETDVRRLFIYIYISGNNIFLKFIRGISNVPSSVQSLSL